jgi:hypothetical protein
MSCRRFICAGVAILALSFSYQNLRSQTLEEILKKHAEALGGEEVLEAHRNSFVEYQIVIPGGLTGEYKSYFKYPNKLRSETDLDVMNTLTDPNGQVRELAGMELEDIRNEIYFNLYGYFFPERAKGKVEYLGREKAPSISYYVVQTTLEGAEPVKLFINPETYLIDKTVSKQDIEVVTNYFSDYKIFGGIQVATSLVINRGDTAYDVTAKLINIELDSQLSDDLFKIPLPREKDYRFLSDRKFVEIPFVLNSNHIYIPVVVNETKTLNFLLDSGAGMPVLHSQTAKDLGLEGVGKLEGRGVGEATQEVNLITLSSIRLGDLVLDSASGVTMDLEPLSKYEGMPLVGILGYDIFSRFVAKIDYENQKLTLYEPSVFEYKGSGQSLPITLEGNHPHIKAMINGQYEGNFTIDCGARSSLALHTPFVEKHDLLMKTGKKLDVFSGIGIGGKVKGKVTRVESVQIGDFRIPFPLTTLASSEKGAFSSEKIDGNIGGGILNRFTVILNYHEKEVILEPNRGFDHEDDFDMTGLWLTRENDITSVDFVIEDSPAARAGMKEGDQLAEINGLSTKDLPLRDIREMLKAGEGKKVILKIRSDGEEKTISLTLEKLI